MHSCGTQCAEGDMYHCSAGSCHDGADDDDIIDGATAVDEEHVGRV